MVGSWRDQTFGPAILFGRYDRGVDLYSDVAVEFPPLNQALARSLIANTRLSRLLQGYRGRQPIDTAALEEALVKFSYLLVDFPEIVEMEVGPLQVRPDGVQALDARIVIEPKDVHKIARPGSHLIISTYPSKYSTTITLGTEEVEIRAIRPEDEPLWSEMIASLSAETAEYRFFGPVKKITKAMLVRYCHIDYDSEMSIVAIGGEGKRRMLGAASFTAETPGGEEAEFAIVVRDELQRKGLGRRLMSVLIDAARDHYVREIHGHGTWRPTRPCSASPSPSGSKSALRTTRTSAPSSCRFESPRGRAAGLRPAARARTGPRSAPDALPQTPWPPRPVAPTPLDSAETGPHTHRCTLCRSDARHPRPLGARGGCRVPHNYLCRPRDGHDTRERTDNFARKDDT